MSDGRSVQRGQRLAGPLTRRDLFKGAAGGAAGAGLLLGAGRPFTAVADEGGDEERGGCKALARPIPHITGPGHFFFPGPPDGSAPPTFPHFPFAGFDPSSVTDFRGVLATADVDCDGTGTNLETMESVPYHFHADWRFFKGTFVAIDGLEHKGTLTFI